MGHQYRLSAPSDDLGMRRIFPIVLIRGFRVPRFSETSEQRSDFYLNPEGTSQEPEPVEESNAPSVSAGPSSPRRSSSRITRTRSSRRTKRTLPSQPLRRSPRLNKGVVTKT